jgi:hypothetical protein
VTGIEPTPLPSLDAERSPAFVIDPAGVLILINAAWDRVAAGAGGPRAAEAVGTRWLDHIHGDDLRAFYAELFQRICAGGPAEGVTAPCNTPERFRTFRDRFEPVRAPRGSELRGVLVLTTQIGDGPLEEHYRVAPPDPARYRLPNGFLLQCGGCRRVHVAGTSAPREWELVAEYVAHPAQEVTHGLCEVCRELYYGPRRTPS